MDSIDSILAEILITNPSLGVCLIDQDYNIVFMNQWLIKQLPANVKTPIGGNFFQLFPSSQQVPRFYNAVQWCIDQGIYGTVSGKIDSNPLGLMNAQGLMIPLKISLRPIVRESRRYCSIEVLDCTNQVVREKFIRTQAQQLKEAQEKLVVGSKLAAIGEMVGGIAHEINTPLGAMILRASQIKRLLNQKGENNISKAIDLSDVILEICKKIDKIVQGLKVFAHKGGSEGLQQENLNTIIADTVNLCASRTDAQSIKIQVDSVPADAFIQCRSVQICQVLLNLISNAQYVLNSFEGDRWIKIGFQQTNKDYLISISNAGPKIDRAICTKIFQPFFTTKPVGQGTGLGLSLSKGIMQAHQGDIYVDHSCEHTTFMLQIPRAFPEMEKKVG